MFIVFGVFWDGCLLLAVGFGFEFGLVLTVLRGFCWDLVFPEVCWVLGLGWV